MLLPTWGIGTALLAVLASTPALADEPPDPAPGAGGASSSELALFSLEDALNQSTQVASQKAKQLRESPGVITLITHEEIVQSGARDLLDVLSRVPGFSVAVDVEGVVDIGVRGIWAHEGKVLLLIDGIEQNELLYTNLALGNHYPVDQIQSIEIIRGPGSVQYGGYAELAVISVHMRTVKDLDNGLSVAGTYGELPRGLARRNLSLYGGATVPGIDGLALTLTGMVGQGNRSDRIFTGQAGDTFDMANGSDLDPQFLNLGIQYKDLTARLLWDNYRVGARDGYGVVLPPPELISFKSLFAVVDYNAKVTSRFRLVPRFEFQERQPWRNTDVNSALFYEKTALRTDLKLTAIYDILDELTVSAGGEVYVDHAKVDTPLLTGSQTPFPNGHVQYDNEALFAEALYDSIIGNLVAGARFEHNSAVGNSFVPRVGLTKRIGQFHFKLLYSGAFRAPGVEQINSSLPGLLPEKTWVAEAELGYQLGDHFFFSANVFDMTVYHPIVYTVDPATLAQGYVNWPQTGTRGAELDAKAQYGWGFVDLSYSFYTAAGKNQVTTYSVPGSADELLGFPQHKVALNASFRLWRTLTLNPSGILLGTRYGYPTLDASGNPLIAQFGATCLLNLYLLYRDLLIPGLDLGAGVFNLLNQYNPYIQPYNSGHAPLPGPSREIMARLSYTHAF